MSANAELLEGAISARNAECMAGPESKANVNSSCPAITVGPFWLPPEEVVVGPAAAGLKSKLSDKEVVTEFAVVDVPAVTLAACVVEGMPMTPSPLRSWLNVVSMASNAVVLPATGLIAFDR